MNSYEKEEIAERKRLSLLSGTETAVFGYLHMHSIL